MNVIVQGGLVDLIPMKFMNVIVQGGLVDLIPMKFNECSCSRGAG